MTPFVSVPVLSKTAYFISFITSRISGFLIKIPSFAPFPTELTMAIGVANPKAQGHEIINTEIEAKMAPKVSPTIKNQTKNVRTDITMTAGTKILATLSAKRLIGIFLLCAVLKSATILESVVSFDSFNTSTSITPVVFKVPAMTSSPMVLYTGIYSPVIIEVSISALPLVITASVDIFSPVLIKTLSPILSSFANMVFKLPSSKISVAFKGAKSMSFFKKSVALAFERSSSNRPKRINVIITTAPSK